MDLHACNTILVFGGSFDPPQMAHIVLPMLAMEATKAQAVAYVPAARAPHKLDRAQTDPRHRLAMLRLALENVPWTHVLTDELTRCAHGEPSYTVDTLEALRQTLSPRVRLRLLIGTDQLRIFPIWRAWQRIVELAEPAVMLRPPDTRAGVLQSLPAELNPAEWEPRLVDLPQLDVSSTNIRARVAAGKPIVGLVPVAVEDYIRREKLYRGKGPRG